MRINNKNSNHFDEQERYLSALRESVGFSGLLLLIREGHEICSMSVYSAVVIS